MHRDRRPWSLKTQKTWRTRQRVESHVAQTYEKEEQEEASMFEPNGTPSCLDVDIEDKEWEVGRHRQLKQ